MSGPSKPIGSYPVAELPTLPATGAADEPTPPAAPAEAVPAAPRVEPAKLAFVTPRGVNVPLKFPFYLGGDLVEAITVRRLIVGEVRDIAGAGVDDPNFSLYSFYAPMTGLPEAVLLGLVDEDGEAVIEACNRFLPRLARQVFFGPTTDSGDASPSSQPAA